MPNTDEILLNRTGEYQEKLSGPEEENAAARVLRREQIIARQPRDVSGSDVEESTFNQARLRVARDQRGKEKEDTKTPPPNKIAGITASLLRKSWLSAPTVIGFILGFIYINIHLFMSFAVGTKFFCKLGEEWGMMTGAGKVSKPNFLKYGEKAAGLGEKALIALIDAIILIIFLAIVFFLVVISNAGKTVVEAGWEAISNWVEKNIGI